MDSSRVSGWKGFGASSLAEGVAAPAQRRARWRSQKLLRFIIAIWLSNVDLLNVPNRIVCPALVLWGGLDFQEIDSLTQVKRRGALF